MIQRIQSIYLLLGALALVGVLLLSELWLGTVGEQLPWLRPVLVVLNVVPALLAILSIFLYKDRARQRKFVLVVQMLTVVFMLLLFGGLYMAQSLPVLSGEAVDTGGLLLLGLPVLAYLFFFLGRRGIDKDIALIRSVDRLR